MLFAAEKTVACLLDIVYNISNKNSLKLNSKTNALQSCDGCASKGTLLSIMGMKDSLVCCGSGIFPADGRRVRSVETEYS